MKEIILTEKKDFKVCLISERQTELYPENVSKCYKQKPMVAASNERQEERKEEKNEIYKSCKLVSDKFDDSMLAG